MLLLSLNSSHATRGVALVSMILWITVGLLGLAAIVMTVLANKAQKSTEAVKWDLVEIFEEHAEIEEKVAGVKAETIAARREVTKEIEKTTKLGVFYQDALFEFGFSETEVDEKVENLTK